MSCGTQGWGAEEEQRVVKAASSIFSILFGMVATNENVVVYIYSPKMLQQHCEWNCVLG